VQAVQSNEQTKRGLLDPILFISECATIAAGILVTIAVLARGRADYVEHRHDRAQDALAAISTCDSGAGDLAKLHAWLDGAELPGDPHSPPPPVDAALRARGAALYAKHCATCHGIRGDGTGPTASSLIHPPANFTLGIFELRTTEHESLPADADLFRTISRGVHGTAMPPWFALPELDRWALAAHLKTLSKQFAEDEAPPPVDVRAPAVTPARVEHGAKLFATGGCASCHGGDGRGDGPAAAGLTYKSGQPVHPRDLRWGRFHRGTRLADVYLTLVTGLDGTPMGSFAKVMTPDDLWDVAIYVTALAPPTVDLADGTRCVHATAYREPNADELVGARTLLGSLPLNQ
jgi:mono/diheme cytochrome c family protein